MRAARASRIEEQKKAAAAIRQAVETALTKQKAELQGQGDAQAAARHVEELRAVEERLKKQHEEELKRAVEDAKAGVAANPDQQAVIEAAVSARLRELQEKHEQEVVAAIERGRLEAGAKMKLKDAQLVRAQTRVKELEALQLQLKSGAPAQSPATAAAQPTASPSTSNAAAKPVAPAGGSQKSTASRPSGLPQKPGAAPAGATRGRGGAPRGGARGGAAGLSIRGAAPNAAASAESSQATASPTDGVSIMGAASKRPREDGGEASGDDSLAKRLKPEGATKPVQLRRDRVPPPPPSS